MKTIEEVARIAAERWADRVASPKFDNGDPSFTGFITKALAEKLVKPVSNESRTKLISHLVGTIVVYLSNTDSRVNMILGVDYGPDRCLAEAAHYAGIPTTNFPIKTTMWVSKNHIAVRYGYGAVIEYLYANSNY